MKNKMKRLNCFILAFAVCLTLLPAMTPLASVANNTKKTAQSIKSKNSYTGVLNNGETAWYKYKVEKSGYIQLSINHTDSRSGGMYTSVVVDNKKLLDKEYLKDIEFTSAKLGLAKGTTVYILVEIGDSYFNEASPYSLSVKNVKSSNWESEINNSKGKADTIKAGKKYYGNSYSGSLIDANAEKDFFKFKSTKTGKLKVSFGSKEMDTDCSYSFKVYVNTKEKFRSYEKNSFQQVAKINVKKGDQVYFIIHGTDSYIDYALRVKY